MDQGNNALHTEKHDIMYEFPHNICIYNYTITFTKNLF